MTMRKSLIFGTIAAAVFTAGAASAAEGRSKHWDKLDADGDGKVSLSEMDERQRAFFAEADADGDGAISKEEMRAHMKAKRGERRAKMIGDADGDGSVTRAEYDLATSQRFDKLDADGDGVISEEEMKAGRRGKHGKRGRE